jgi:hypothetical protein
MHQWEPIPWSIAGFGKLIVVEIVMNVPLPCMEVDGSFSPSQDTIFRQMIPFFTAKSYSLETRFNIRPQNYVHVSQVVCSL